MRRWGLWALAAFLLVLLATPFVLRAALERGAFTETLDAALERATGRAVTLGPIALSLSLPPKVSVRDVRVANLPGMQAPDFARIGRLEVTLALRALLDGHAEIRELRLAEAELWLERDASGAANWRFGGEGGGAGGGAMPALVRVESSRLHPPDGLPGPLGVESLTIRRPPAGGIALQGRIRLREEAMQAEASLDASAMARATLAGEGFRLTGQGRVAASLADPAWNLALTADVASPARLMALLGSDAVLPALGPLTGSARLGPAGKLSDLRVAAGASQPSAGLTLSQVVLAAPALDQAMTLSLQGQRGRAPLAAEFVLPAPRTAFTASAPMPVTAHITSGPARLTARGAFTWSNPLGAAPFDVTLSAPHLAPLGPLLGLELPALRQVEAQGRLSRAGASALRWEAARLDATGLQATGAVTIRWGGRPSVHGSVQFAMLDLAAALPAAGPAAPRASGRVIPDIALPVAALRGFDATLDLAAERVQAAGLSWRGLRSRVTLAAGRLELADFTVTSPGGAFGGRIGWDVASTPPRATLALRSAGHGLDIAAIRRELGAGIGVQGPVEVALDLRGEGATTRALAASVSGAAGLAMVEGRLSRAGMFQIGPDLTRILLMGRAPPEGVEIRCFALSFAAEAGMLRSEALLLESSAGRITGSLAVNLRNETLAAQLRPDLRVFGATMRAPVGIGGTLAAPRVGVEPGQALAQVVGDTVANRLWRSSTVEWLRGDSGEQDCPAQLRQARLGRAGREPAPAPAVIPLVPRELQAPVQEVFRGLGGLLGGRR
ncbi:AsmA family protein [Roseococcus sp. SDR]|uniref:AsmA family protein n=1 Tax=Roseococcus sp. SDR TaxID=2835532 RepID=UPI001BCC734D|nr:AsmA family protein [Roseococcus sp. SDR]MBS7792967.1 AsmA family protein [Roseococcus sp. SDR]MBV1848281.1 AsmA family protein [Roseococcus sp. SDR]